MKQVEISYGVTRGTPASRQTGCIVRTINPEKPQLAIDEAWQAFFAEKRFLMQRGYTVEWSQEAIRDV